MNTDIISTKYFGQLDPEEFPILEETQYPLPLDGREVRVTTNWAIIAPEAFSEAEHRDFLASMDSIPQMHTLVKESIRREFSRRTLFTRSIRSKPLRDFVMDAELASPGLRIEACEDLLEGLYLHEITFAQGPCGEFACEMYYRFGTRCKATLCAEFSGPAAMYRFYCNSN